QRKEDIPLLIHHFLKIFNEKFKKRVTMDKKVIDLFIQYYWPGNIRQLKNLVQSLVLLNDSGVISIGEIPAALKEEKRSGKEIGPFRDEKNAIIEEFERKYITNLLKLTAGDVARAAETGKMDKNVLADKIGFYNINPADYQVVK
ncbi:MAG: hypothetical protein PHF84_11470, partial [bacterium]|nr:hypothetical protein [bacterium]